MLRSLAAPTLRIAQQVQPLASRSLVSSVLLSRDVYDSKKVADLKTELKQRGLSSTGKRAELVKRLLEDDSNRSTDAPRKNSSLAALRNASTSTTSSPPPPSSSVPHPELSEGNVGVEGGKGASIPQPPGMEPGQVSSNFNDPAQGGITPPKPMDAEANAPGVPPQKEPNAPITFEVKIPYEAEPPQPRPETPLMTSYFHPGSPSYSRNHEEEPPLNEPPKVMTVSAASTFHGGGISHTGQDFGQPEDPSASAASPSDPDTIRSAVDSLISSFRSDLGVSNRNSSNSLLNEVERPARAAAKTIYNDARDGLSHTNSTSGSANFSTSSAFSSDGSGSYSGGNTRPLNEEESRGLYVLGGIVIGGFLLGGVAKPSQRRVNKVKAQLEDVKQKVRQETSKDILPDVNLAALVARAEQALQQGASQSQAAADAVNSPSGKGRVGKALDGVSTK